MRRVDQPPPAGTTPVHRFSTVVLYLETGPVGEVVRRLVADQSVDLVVTNRGQRQQPFGKLRTHTYEVVLQSPCPVLSLTMAATESSEAAEHAALQIA